MVSRKKAKGRERKAAKEAKAADTKEQEQGELEAQMQQLTISSSIDCRHHQSSLLSEHEQKEIVQFVKTFQAAFNDECNGDSLTSSFNAGLSATIDKFSDLWNDDEKMEKVVSVFVAGGTVSILDGNDVSARRFASFACFFEQHIKAVLQKTQPMTDWQSIGELDWADVKTLISFFRKRIPCKCLDKKYKEVKSVVKMGICRNPKCSLPDRRAERQTMFHCSRCRDDCYCSVECQKENWPFHKQYCSEIAKMKASLETCSEGD